jgi:hypothetical protein
LYECEGGVLRDEEGVDKKIPKDIRSSRCGGAMKLRWKGGVWQCSAGKKQNKKIKSLRQYITWMSSIYYGSPVHIVTCYISPYNDEETKGAVCRLKYLISSIMRRDSKAKVLIMVDFNQYRNDMK